MLNRSIIKIEREIEGVNRDGEDNRCETNNKSSSNLRVGTSKLASSRRCGGSPAAAISTGSSAHRSQPLAAVTNDV